MAAFVVIGGGAAGFFAAITAAEAGLKDILILEKGPEVLTKVKISGGGRCNVTHSCFEARDLVKFYPRGEKSLRGPFSRFQAADTVAWFRAHGVELKTEADGRMFPVSNCSQTVIDCLTETARELGVVWRTGCGVSAVEQVAEGGYRLTTTTGEVLSAERLLVATGGSRTRQARQPADDLQLTMEAPTPSLFTFKIRDERIEGLQGASVPWARVKVGKLAEEGPLLVTHWGLSGPAILKLSAWGARELAAENYEFELKVNWLGGRSQEEARIVLEKSVNDYGARKIQGRSPFEGLPKRIWQRLAAAAAVGEEQTWANLQKKQREALLRELCEGRFSVVGKSLNKDEFVTCGGVPLKAVNLRTMESRQAPGLYFAGEILDIDGVTGGFNFQGAWTTGYLAGKEAARASLDEQKGFVPFSEVER